MKPVTADEAWSLFKISGADSVSARAARFIDVSFDEAGIRLEPRDHA